MINIVGQFGKKAYGVWIVDKLVNFKLFTLFYRDMYLSKIYFIFYFWYF